MFGYFVVLGLLFVLFLKINGRLFDRRTAGVSGLAALVLAALFPFSAFSLGPVKTVLLYLGAAPLIGWGTYRLTRIRTTVQAGIPPALLALPPAPAVAALPAAGVQDHAPGAPPPVIEQPEVRPAAAEGPAETPVVDVTHPSPIISPDTPADSPVTAMAGVEMPPEGEKPLPVAEAKIPEEAEPETAISPAAENLAEDAAETVAQKSSVPGETLAQALDETVVDTPVTNNEAAEPVRAEHPAEEPEETAPATVAGLVSRALAAARSRDFARAVTLLTEALRLRPEPALEWVIVAHLSDIYQHLGQYRLAAELINAFLSVRQAGDHPLIPVLRRKEAFCRSLDRILIRRGTPNLAYASVPEDLKGLAFREAMAVRAA